jgi:hypothetical protein
MTITGFDHYTIRCADLHDGVEIELSFGLDELP